MTVCLFAGSTRKAHLEAHKVMDDDSDSSESEEETRNDFQKSAGKRRKKESKKEDDDDEDEEEDEHHDSAGLLDLSGGEEGDGDMNTGFVGNSIKWGAGNSSSTGREQVQSTIPFGRSKSGGSVDSKGSNSVARPRVGNRAGLRVARAPS